MASKGHVPCNLHVGVGQCSGVNVSELLLEASSTIGKGVSLGYAVVAAALPRAVHLGSNLVQFNEPIVPLRWVQHLTTVGLDNLGIGPSSDIVGVYVVEGHEFTRIGLHPRSREWSIFPRTGSNGELLVLSSILGEFRV